MESFCQLFDGLDRQATPFVHEGAECSAVDTSRLRDRQLGPIVFANRVT